MGEQKKDKRTADLIIVGGGAAGMMAGILAARNGLRVSILEKNRHLGKKLGVTGNGKCNFTSGRQTPGCYRSDTPALAWEILKRYPVSDTLARMEELGIVPWKRGEGYYPASGLAGDVTKAFLLELERLSVTCRTNLAVTGIQPDGEGFLVQTEGYAYPASSVLLAAGGLAAPQYGTEGDGYQIAERLGHTIVPMQPALTALKVGSHPVTKLAGLRQRGGIRLYQQMDKVLPEDKQEREAQESLLSEDIGELQFTSYGISGIPAMQVSRFAARALAAGRTVWAELDICPEQTPEELEAWIHKRRELRKDGRLSDWFVGWLPEKLGSLLLESAGLKEGQRVSEVPEEGWSHLVCSLKGLRVPVEGVRSYDAAQTTAGGVSLAECSQTLESKRVPGLFFAGEVLDVDGACGGYNLQWAWSSAACAVEGIVKRSRERQPGK